jgi:hypothetical protein
MLKAKLKEFIHPYAIVVHERRVRPCEPQALSMKTVQLKLLPL